VGISLSASESLNNDSEIRAALLIPDQPSVSKILHIGDPDLYFTYKFEQSTNGVVQLSWKKGEVTDDVCPVTIEILRMGMPQETGVTIEYEPNDTWNTANPVRLGVPVYGAADDIEYLYNTREGEVGIDWFTFEYDGENPKLVFFQIELLDADVPCDIRVYRENASGQGLQDFSDGANPPSSLHDNQTKLRNKFLTHVISKGRYYIRVNANHPAYKLRTTLYDVPPYDDPREAVQTGMDYLINEADAWFHNIPRLGAIYTRRDMEPGETYRCTACHVGHFPVRANLIAVENNYPIQQKMSFKYMMDRLYNAMVPLAGYKEHPDDRGVHWTRFDVAPGNGISRIADMIQRYETHVSGRATGTSEQAIDYMALVYRDRSELPEDDFDGNRPVSKFKVARDAWSSFDYQYRRMDREKYRDYARHTETLIAISETEDLEDLMEQTIALTYIDKTKYAEQISANVQQILEEQLEDGGWTSAFYRVSTTNTTSIKKGTLTLIRPEFPADKSETSNMGMTGQALYTLALAGLDADHPQIRRGIERLLPNQQGFGGWLDAYGELFRTPFLETKWAVIAFSQLFPGPGGEQLPVNDSPDPERTSISGLLLWMDGIWKTNSGRIVEVLVKLLRHPEPMVRANAAASLGRLGIDQTDGTILRPAVQPLLRALGDNYKMIGRAAAWALRQFINAGIAREEVLTTLQSPDVRTRIWASRIYFRHFYHMRSEYDHARALTSLLHDSHPLTQLHAIQGVWQWWDASFDAPEIQKELMTGLVGHLSHEDLHPHVFHNLTDALFFSSDDNENLLRQQWLHFFTEEGPESYPPDEGTQPGGPHRDYYFQWSPIEKSCRAGWISVCVF